MTRWTYHLCLPILVLVLGCGEGSPVAPPGTLLTINASPSRISLNGDSVITVTGRRPDGNRLAEGTEVRLSTTLGTITPVIAEVDRNGIATAVLSGDGRPGTATVSAATGAGGEGATMATIDVLIGQSAETNPSLLVSANPDDIPVGGTSTITVIAREADGSPVGAGRTIVLTTTLGTLQPSRPQTNADGVATSTLVAGDDDGEAVVGAILGSSEQATTTVSIRDAPVDITLTAAPSSLSRPTGQPATVALTALVTDARGDGVNAARVVFLVNRGSLSPSVAVTNNDGIATSTLTLRPEDFSDNEGQVEVPVTARTVNAEGQAITATVVITVTTS